MSDSNKDRDKPEKAETPASPKESRPVSGPEENPARTESGEDILFPKKPETERKQTAERYQKRSRFANLILLLILATGFYLLGHLTNPEQFDHTKQALRDMVVFIQNQVVPYKEKMVDYIETRIQRPKTGEAPKQEGSGTTVQGPPVAQREKPEQSRKVKYWQAPMDPSYISDKPGKGPMGMDLVPVYEDEAGPGKITINPNITQNIGIKTATVRERKLTRQIRTIGTLTYDERKVHHIHTKFGGWIEKLYVNFTGQKVEKNDIVMDIYSPELVSTQEEFLLALQYKDSLEDSPFDEVRHGAQTLLASTRRRLELFDVAPHQIEELIQTRKVKKTMHIHSAIRGFVVHKKAEHGQYVEPGTPLYTIADLSNIWVLADIYEYELPWVKVGQKAVMTLSYFPGKEFKGKVTYIDPFMDPKTRTLKVRMEFRNPDWKLKPDMYANVLLESTITKKGVAVPEQAVLRSGEKDFVIVQVGPGRFIPREVRLGVQSEGFFQVMDGLKAGETVVTSSNFLIDSESSLREALDKLGMPGTQTSSEKTQKTKKELKLQLDERNKSHVH